MQPFRIVLVTKRFPLGEYFQRRLAEAGFLVGTVFEHPSRLATLRRIAKRQGWVRAADVLAFELYERIFRGAQFRSVVATTLGAQAHLPALPEYDVASANAPEAREFIASLHPHVIVVHATGLLKPDTFQLAPFAVNLHCGILPEYRGHDALFWALAKGDENHLGSTIHVIDSGADTGAVLSHCLVRREPGDTDITIWIRAFVAGVDGLLAILGGPFPEEKRPASKRYEHWQHRGLSDHLKYLRASRRWMVPFPKSGHA
jgi:methionyl-tRNA formyltransferase